MLKVNNCVSAKQLLEASTCITKVPDCLAGWEDDFQVPLQYSTATMVNFGKGCLNSLARLITSYFDYYHIVSIV